MKRVVRLAPLLLFSLLSLFLLPGIAAAGACMETVTIQVDFTTPNGLSVIGTVVAHRTIGNPTQTELSFTGMINGSPATATAEATESWSGDSQATVTITKITGWHAAVAQPALLTLHVLQTGPGLISVNGLPVAINGQLHAPQCGVSTYTFTNPGQGPTQIVVLPNTGAGELLADPLVIVALLIMPGLLLVLLGSMVGKLAGRSLAATRPTGK